MNKMSHKMLYIALMPFIFPAIIYAETSSENGTFERDKGGITIKKRVKHSKPSVSDLCPKKVDGYAISPREAVNEAAIRDWAHNGVVKHQALLGAILLEGRLAKRDPLEASYWLNCAAESGAADAALNLALQIYYADGIEQDFTRAAKLAKQSALAGLIMGQRLLGNMYSSGQGVSKDIDEAVRWHTMAAEQGDMETQAALGYRFLVADDVPRNLNLAIKWLSLAAEAGHQQSKDNLEIALEMQQNAVTVSGQIAK